MKTRLFAAALIFILFVTGNHPTAQAAGSTVTTIYSSEDTYVDNAKPTTNFGSIVTMWIRGNTPTRRGLLRFNLSAIPANAQISSAVLKLFVSSDGSPVAGNVYSVNGSWTESTVTYSTAPQVGGLIAALPNPATPSSSVSINLTSSVIGKSSVAFYITTSNSDGVVYYTHEKGSAQAPRLTITWTTGTTPTQTPTGISTATQTRTSTPTRTSTSTRTNTPNPLATNTPTLTRTSTPTGTNTSTRTDTPTPLATNTPTQTRTSTPTGTSTSTSTNTSTPLATNTPTQTRTSTPTGTNTSTSTNTSTPTASPTTSPFTATPTPLSGGSLTLPLRLAFYYPWFPEAWTQGGIYPYTNYTPTLGFYDSSSLQIINQHIADMQYADIQGGIASWWGQKTPTDGRIKTLLSAAGSGFKWTLYYEPEGSGNPTSAAISSDLSYIFNNYAQNQGYLRIGGKPVLFVYADATDGCGMADRWKAANTLGFYMVLKVFGGYTACLNQPEGWHQYGPAVNYDQQGSYSVTISPGFWKKGNTAMLPRDLTRWNQDISNMVAANPNFQLITTWNEWGEGTSVESSLEFGRAYLDALHNNGQVTPTPNPTDTALPTPTSTATSQPGGSDPTIVAAGDIICDSLTTTSAGCQQMAASQVAVDQNPTAALILGDLCHTPSANCFNNYFAPSWGRLFSIAHPTTGNHDYLVAGALYYFDYWNGIGNVSGPAGDRSQGYYSYDIGTWHLIALNSQCSEAGGCNTGSAQYTWLQGDLQNHPNQCTLAYYHIPLFSSGGRANNNMLQIFTLLYNNNVDVVLDGHDHIYERFAPQAPNGLADPLRGIREFIVGTGGANHTSIATIQPNSEVRNTDTFGALKLTLHPTGYDWQFMPMAGKTFTDSGSTVCH